MLFIVLVGYPVHTSPMYGLPPSQSDQRIHFVFQSAYSNNGFHVRNASKINWHSVNQNEARFLPNEAFSKSGILILRT